MKRVQYRIAVAVELKECSSSFGEGGSMVLYGAFMRWLLLAFLVVPYFGVFHSSTVNAEPITYTYEGHGSGFIERFRGGERYVDATFAGALITITATADTDSVRTERSWLENDHVSAVIDIDPVGS